MFKHLLGFGIFFEANKQMKFQDQSQFEQIHWEHVVDGGLVQVLIGYYDVS